MKRTNKILIGLLALFACIAVMYGVFRFSRPEPDVKLKNVVVEVVDNNGEKESYTVATDAMYLKDVMDNLAVTTDFSFEGGEGDYGFFITAINGLEAVYEKDNAYWAIYVNGEYGQYGADQQPVADGDTFTFAYEESAW